MMIIFMMSFVIIMLIMMMIRMMMMMMTIVGTMVDIDYIIVDMVYGEKPVFLSVSRFQVLV